MIATDTTSEHSESAWRRLLRMIAQFEEAMEATHDDRQDQRIDQIEKELGAIRSQVHEMLQRERSLPDR